MKTKAVAKLSVASEVMGVGGNRQTRKKNGPLIEKRSENKNWKKGDENK